VVVATGAHLGTVQALGLYRSSNVTKLAMRAYYALPSDLDIDPYLQIHLEQNLLPYYGWVFPVDARTLNIGVGADRSEQGEGQLRAAFECFIDRNPQVREQLVGAKQVDRLRGWPMRTGFLHRRTYDDGVLAVGEAAGLVDPLTGEGISFALQSGALAAEAACEALAEGNVSSAKLSAYGRALQRRYAAYFRYTQLLRSRVRDPGLADVLVALAREAKKARAARWAPGALGSLLWFAFQKRQVLGLTPYLAYRLLRARAISIEV
jgi:flavin-dependent dehydrogenase